jgi:hypothetical protein
VFSTTSTTRQKEREDGVVKAMMGYPDSAGEQVHPAKEARPLSGERAGRIPTQNVSELLSYCQSISSRCFHLVSKADFHSIEIHGNRTVPDVSANQTAPSEKRSGDLAVGVEVKTEANHPKPTAARTTVFLTRC